MTGPMWLACRDRIIFKTFRLEAGCLHHSTFGPWNNSLVRTSKLSISSERSKTQVTRGGGEGDFLPLPLALPSPPGKWRVCLQAIKKIVNVFGWISVICWIVFYVIVATGEVPYLDSYAYLFSKKRKEQISLKQHRLQSAYLQPLLVQWNLLTTNFYNNEVLGTTNDILPPITCNSKKYRK